MQKKLTVTTADPANSTDIPKPNAGLPGVWPTFGEDEIAAVAEVLRSSRVNQWTGDRVRAFENVLARACGARHAIAVANGSLGLELALRALGIGAGDEVIVTSRSFIASASCVDIVGARPVFADVNAETQNVSCATIAPLITARTRAVIPVHLAGWPCDMPAIMALAQKHELAVIEDCAQAIGARIDGRPVGSFGDAAVLSFCQDKIISTGGEGGALLLNDDLLWRAAWAYKDHGKDWDVATSPAKGSSYRWLHRSIGTNWRMTEMQAAIGLVQMGKLDGWLAQRQALAHAWIEGLRPLHCLDIPLPPPNIQHAWYKLYAFVQEEHLQPGVGRDQILAHLNNSGIRAYFGSCPEIYREGAYARQRIRRRPVARRLGETSLMFEVHPTLHVETVHQTAQRVVELLAPMQRASQAA